MSVGANLLAKLLNPDAGSEEAANVRLFSLGRHALVAGLRMAGLVPGDKVLVPEFICRDLLASIHAVEAVPHFYPVDRTLAPQLPLPSTGAKAILAVDYFGFPQRLDPFREFCTRHGGCLIEDNAHGFLSSDSLGNPLGSRGDFGIVSMRKTIAAPDGAALLLNRKDWVNRLPAPLPCRNDALPAGFVLRRALRRVQNTTGVQVRSLSERAARRIRRLATGHAFPAPLPESERDIPGRPAIHCRSLDELRGIDATAEVERRRSLYRRFEERLGPLGVEPLFAGLAQGVAPFGYPFRAGGLAAVRATRLAQKDGFDCARWPDLPDAVLPTAPDFHRNVWCVNFLW